ncbi:MAG: SusC/RagA family TonB-linked outer membrane protein [Phaeodactylibacter sp.]|nr:SusC/RagA family TonB-linked outer membrane protein [Phaeodactylibacter sp.]MCB9276757.1 SusC/RagA family TonB-linked outer membrane protein [Lewinellaceae bacterium]
MKRLLLVLPMVLFAFTLLMAQRTVTGTVTDEENTPLIGASVLVKGTTSGTVTDIDGKYSLRVPDGSNTLVFSYTGYTSKEMGLGASNVVDVVLSQSAELLDEVVVTALGFETKRSKVGTASSTVEGNSLVRSGEVGLLNSLAGKSAGVNIVSSSGDPGAGARIVIRGATSITGDLQPLIVIDGVPIFNDSYYGEAFGGQARGNSGSIGSGGGVTQQSRLNDINPEDIANVEVLRGASAAAVWGSRAANGVIVITTKKGKYNKQKNWTVNFNSSVAFDQVNQEVPLTNAYGGGINGQFQFNPSGGLSWGDRISDRSGGQDAYITDPGAAGYAGYFELSDGTRYYSLANGTANNPHGGKNSRDTYSPYDYLFQTGTTISNSLGLSTATENGSVYFSFANLQQDGVIKAGSDYDRTTARLNATRRLGDKFTIEANMGYTYSKSNRVQMGSNLNGLFLGGLRSSVDFNDDQYVGTYVNAAGQEFPDRQRAYRNPLGASTNSIYDNPVWMIYNIPSTSKVNRTLGKLELRYEPTTWLNFTARGGLDTYTDEREDIYPVIAAGTNNGGRFTKETITRTQISTDFIARARFDLADQINMSALAGVGINDQRLDDAAANSRTFINPFSPPQLNNATNFELFNREEVTRTAGVYATLGFEFYDQLFVNLSARNDWLSTLPVDDNSVFYPAADVAWMFSKLLPSRDVLSSGRIRGGYGQVGRGPDPYLTGIDFYAPTAANTGFGEGWGPGVNPGAYGGGFAQSTIAGNPNIKPEIKTEIEGGIDLGFVKDRFNLGFTYYTNTTDDLIISVVQPSSTGFTSQIANAATIENKGIELELDLGIISKNDLSFNIYGNFTHNRNEVTEMVGTESLFLAGFSGGSSRAVVGEQLGVLFAGTWARDASGNLDLDENGFPQLGDVSGVIGDPNPDWRAGIGGLLNYKGFSLNVLFDHSEGGDIWNGTRGALAYFGRAESTGVTTTLSSDQANTLKIYGGKTVAEQYPFWQNSDGSYTVRGEVKDYGAGPVFVEEQFYRVGPGSGFTGPEENFVEDATWSRLREVTLSYNFGNNLTNWLRGASLSLTGRNLLLWTDYQGNDPDTNLTGAGQNGFGLDYFNNPGTRTYKVTLNLNF